MQTLYGYLKIPDKCLINKPIFKKLFQENTALNFTDKRVLKEDIDKICWIYSLKPSTLNIEPYRDDILEYDEVAVIQIDLSSAKRARRISIFVNMAIPYPIVIVFRSSDKIAISIARKRINQANKSKWVVEGAWITEWFNPDVPNEAQQKFMHDMEIKKLSFVNFYAFYTDIICRVIALNSATLSGYYQAVSPEKTEDRIDCLKVITVLEREITELRSVIKKEMRFNKKLALNITVKKHQETINQLVQTQLSIKDQ